MVRLWLESLTQRQALTAREQSALLMMSSRTMDRILRPHRGALRRRLYCLRPERAIHLIAIRGSLDPIALSEAIDAGVASVLALDPEPAVKATRRGPDLRALSRAHVRTARLAEGYPVRTHVAP